LVFLFLSGEVAKQTCDSAPSTSNDEQILAHDKNAFAICEVKSKLLFSLLQSHAFSKESYGSPQTTVTVDKYDAVR